MAIESLQNESSPDREVVTDSKATGEKSDHVDQFSLEEVLIVTHIFSTLFRGVIIGHNLISVHFGQIINILFRIHRAGGIASDSFFFN